MLTVKQFANHFNVSVRSVHNWIGVGIVKSNEIIRPTGKGKGKPIRIAESAVRRLSNNSSEPINQAYNDRLNDSLRQRLGIKSRRH